MAVYAIGDIQGCFDPLRQLLDEIGFDPGADRLWFAGDLVNRGPKSLETLRFVRDLGDRAVTVLGNHDLHLLAVWQHNRHLKPGDTLAAILEAPDGDELLQWLRRRPLMHHEPELGPVAMVHAGLSPQWDLETALRCAREVEQTLRGPEFTPLLDHMYGNEPRRWSEALAGWERLRFSINCFTRLRFCTPDGTLEFEHKGRPGSQSGGFLPWFEVEGRRSRDAMIVFGHWSTLGFYKGHGVCALDSGCLWGGRLTAVRLDDPALPAWSIDCPAAREPGRGE